MAFIPTLPAALSPPRHRRRRHHSLSRRLPTAHLPPTAYTTLQADGTPLCRLITGMPPSPPHAAPTSARDLTRAIHAAVDAGLCTFDLAAAPGPAGHFAREYARVAGRAASRRAQFCATLAIRPRDLPRVSRRVVEAYVDRALQSMAVERIHLLQLRWPDVGDGRYVEFLGHLGEMKERGKVRSVGAADFPTRQLREVRRQGVQVVSNRVAFGLMDTRALVEMAGWCAENGVAVLACSVLGSGIFSEEFLGMPEPTRKACEAAGLQRVVGFIRVWGGWSLFQELLYALKIVADKYNVTIENVVVAWALQQKALSAVVVGARWGAAGHDHVHATLKAFELLLDDEDMERLDAVAIKGNDMYRLLGDSGNEYQPNR